MNRSFFVIVEKSPFSFSDQIIQFSFSILWILKDQLANDVIFNHWTRMMCQGICDLYTDANGESFHIEGPNVTKVKTEHILTCS